MQHGEWDVPALRPVVAVIVVNAERGRAVRAQGLGDPPGQGGFARGAVTGDSQHHRSPRLTLVMTPQPHELVRHGRGPRLRPAGFRALRCGEPPRYAGWRCGHIPRAGRLQGEPEAALGPGPATETRGGLPFPPTPQAASPGERVGWRHAAAPAVTAALMARPRMRGCAGSDIGRAESEFS